MGGNSSDSFLDEVTETLDDTETFFIIHWNFSSRDFFTCPLLFLYIVRVYVKLEGHGRIVQQLASCHQTDRA